MFDKICKKIINFITSVCSLGIAILIYKGVNWEELEALGLSFWSCVVSVFIFVGIDYFIKFEKE